MTEWDNPTFHEGRRWGRMEERERIIKLLEIEIGELEGHEGSCDCKTRADELRVTIALVEGEEQ